MIEKIQNINRHKLYLIFGCILYLISRILFMCIYNFNYTDQDQVVMWAGTVMFSHGHIKEPMWLGQDYGSMLESLLAVPLYWCKVPLNIALPISSLIIGLLPFALVMFFCIREEKYFQGWFILIILMMFSIDMDVLTSIPRTFIPGYFVTTAGVLICCKCEKKGMQILGGFLTMLGIVMSETAICIVLPVLICILWRHEKLKKQAWAIIGIVLGYLLQKGIMLFYDLHPEYVIWGKPALHFDVQLFWGRMHEFTYYFKNLIIFENAWVFLVLILLLFLFLFATNNIGESLTVMATIGGLFLTLGFSKIDRHDCVLWSASRQFLFVPYNLAFAIYFSHFSFDFSRLENMNIQKYVRRLVPVIITLAVCLCTLIKYVDYKDRETEFKTSELNEVISVSYLKDIVQAEYDKMLEYGYDFAVIGNSTQALAIEALYDEKVTAYGQYFDRNNYVFLKERYNIRPEVLFISYENGEAKAEVKETDNRSAIQYLFDEYGILRSSLYHNWEGTKVE